MATNRGRSRLAVLSGGVGGAKLALGLSRLVRGDALGIIANVGDDFTHLGLSISPDLDTLMYSLSGLVNPETGWGCKEESWQFLTALEQLGGETWFRLGDRDLAVHIERTRRLAAGETLTKVTSALCGALGISAAIFPATDDPLRTQVRTANTWLDFQDYFVRQRCSPVVSGFRMKGANNAQSSEQALALLKAQNLTAIVIAPSNPYLSIDPILAIKDIRAAIEQSSAPVIAVSPIVGGRALKGPSAKIMSELNLEVTPLTVAQHYGSLLDGFIMDERDSAHMQKVTELGIKVLLCPTVMTCLEDKVSLAHRVLEFAAELG